MTHAPVIRNPPVGSIVSRDYAETGPHAEPVRMPTAASPRRRHQSKRTSVSRYVSLLITTMLVVGAAWELWRFLLLVITSD
jgi:hypothetical protein